MQNKIQKTQYNPGHNAQVIKKRENRNVQYNLNAIVQNAQAFKRYSIMQFCTTAYSIVVKPMIPRAALHKTRLNTRRHYAETLIQICTFAR